MVAITDSYEWVITFITDDMAKIATGVPPRTTVDYNYVLLYNGKSFTTVEFYHSKIILA